MGGLDLIQGARADIKRNKVAGSCSRKQSSYSQTMDYGLWFVDRRQAVLARGLEYKTLREEKRRERETEHEGGSREHIYI